MRLHLQNYIDGLYTSAGATSTFNKIEPSTEEIIAEVDDTSAEGVGLAVSVARKAFEDWRKVSRVKRGEYFSKMAQLVEERKDNIIASICSETGKNKNEAYAEVQESKHMFEITAGRGRMPVGELLPSEIAGKNINVIRKPRGVVAVISPFNFPAAIGSAWCAAPAILEGNCVVHKPSQLTPITASWMTRLYRDAGFPKGVYNLVNGRDETGKALVEHPDVNYILFTGSWQTGQKIRSVCANSWNKECSCEMGSKSAVIVMDDANMDIATEACVASAFKLAGQRCVSAGRILVHENVIDGFTDGFLNVVKSLKIDDPLNETDPFFGPVIDEEAVKKVEFYNGLVRDDEDCTILLNGGRMDRKGYFMSPFVYKCNWGNKRFLKEEVFGPHVAIIPFSSLDEAIQIYNDTDFGLSCAVISENFRVMKKFQDEIDAGLIYFNAGSIGAESSVPFGGIKKSGSGYPSAVGNFDAVVHKIAVTTNFEDKITWAQGLK